MQQNTSNRHQVTGAFRFLVEIDALLAAGFSEVSGLQSETEFEEYREGGVNGYIHRFPKLTKSPSLVLKRGVSTSSDLWSWYEDVMAGQINRKHGSIILQDQGGEEICRWNFFDAYPVKWTGPDLKADQSDVAIESLEIVHNGLKTIYKK